MPEPSKSLAIKFFAPVVDASANALMGILDQAINQGVEEVILLLSTPGGSVFHGLSVYNYLRGLPLKKLTTHNFGSVDSIGVVMYCAAKERFSSPQARFLIHGVSANFQGNQSLEEPQLEERLKGIRIDIENIAKVIAANTGKTHAKVVKAMLDRTTLNPEKAKEWGLVNAIKTEHFPAGTRVVSVMMNNQQVTVGASQREE